MEDANLKEYDLFERVNDKVLKDAIYGLLKEFQPQFPDEIRVSGTKSEMTDHLKAAVHSGRIPRERVYRLLQEREENGRQIVLYYSPQNDRVLKICRDPEIVGLSLFGEGWHETMNFPKLTQMTSEGYRVVDFRPGYMGKSQDWIMKIYSYQTSRVKVRDLTRAEAMERGVALTEGGVLVLYEQEVTQSVCLARWNNDKVCPLLEVRVELGRIGRFALDVNAVWTRLKEIFDRETDFRPWPLGRAHKRMLRECEGQHASEFRLGYVHLTDSGEGDIRYVPYTEHESIGSTPVRLQTAIQIIDDGGRCSRLSSVWLAEGSDNLLEKDLRTNAGSRGSNELVIPEQTTNQSVDYVTNRLRYFNS